MEEMQEAREASQAVRARGRTCTSSIARGCVEHGCGGFPEVKYVKWTVIAPSTLLRGNPKRKKRILEDEDDSENEEEKKVKSSEKT